VGRELCVGHPRSHPHRTTHPQLSRDDAANGFCAHRGLELVAISRLFGLGHEPARFTIAIRSGPPSWTYVTIMMGLVVLFEVLPYLEELLRGLKANKGALAERQQQQYDQEAWHLEEPLSGRAFICWVFRRLPRPG
jgi:hypothetical protein